MSTAVIGLADASPRLKARAAAVFCLCAASAAVATFARRALIVTGDYAATAANIVAHERLFRLALVTDVMGAICFVIVIALLHDFKGRLSFIAAQIGLAACAIQIVAAPLDALGSAPFLSAMKIEPLQELALLSLRLHAEALDLVLIFFGIYCVLIVLSFAERTFHAQPLPPAAH